jgi:hypothetical protein
MSNRATRRAGWTPRDHTSHEYQAHLQLWNYNALRGVYPSRPNWKRTPIAIEVAGRRYLIRKSDTGFAIGGQPNREGCGLLLIEQDEDGVRHGVLQGIKKGANCPIPPADDAPGGNIVLVAWKLCFLNKLKYLILDDEANVHCDGDYTFSLSNMYLLTRGKSWYQSLIPVHPIEHPMYKYQYPPIPPWAEMQRRARETRWADVESQLPPDVVRELRPYTAKGDGSAMSVFRAIKESPDSCRLLAMYTELFMTVMGLIGAKRYIWKSDPITAPTPS